MGVKIYIRRKKTTKIKRKCLYKKDKPESDSNQFLTRFLQEDLVLHDHKTINMKPSIIKLNLAGTIVHVNIDHIIYYYAKKEQNGQIATVIYLEKNWGIEVSETPEQIDAIISAASI